MNSKIENGTATETAKLPDAALEDVAGAGFIDDVGDALKTAGQEAAHYGAVVVGAFGDMTIQGGGLHESLPKYVDGKTGRK